MGVRTDSGGSSAASDPDDVAATSGDVKDIEELLANLSMLRLAMSAELSAAAGALEAQRPDIASDLLGGALADLRKLQTSVIPHPAGAASPELVFASASSELAALEALDHPALPTVPAARRHMRFGNWQGRILAGALALGLALVILPHSGGGSSQHPSAAKAQQQQTTDVRLVSAEFTTLRQTLESTSSEPASVISAGQSWHTAVARTLPLASKHAATATQIVSLLRQERALLATPAMRSPSMRQAAIDLKASADGLFEQLRSLADTSVLAVLPDVITALPVPVTTDSPSPSPSPTPAPTTPPPSITPTAPPTGQQTPGVPTTPAPSLGVPTTPAPSVAPTNAPPTLPLPLPLPSLPVLPGLIQHLTGSQDTTGSTPSQSPSNSLSGSVNSALNSLGLGS